MLSVIQKWNIDQWELLPQTALHINEANQLSQENYQPPSSFTNHTLSIDDTLLPSVLNHIILPETYTRVLNLTSALTGDSDIKSC